VCEVARDMLAELGYTVHLAHDGEAGVEFYRKRQGMIDLILLDVNMPVLGGREAFDLLRTLNPAVPIIIITGYGRDALETSTFSSEVNGFIQKPFQLDTLAIKVRQALDGKAVTHQN
jgi:CheY-like chemotaxis protein